jgi:hypothetical protein
VDSDEERRFIHEVGVRRHNEPPTPSRNPIIRRLQRDSVWGPIRNLPDEAATWIDGLAHPKRGPSVKNLVRLRDDWRLTPDSLPLLLDLLSSDDLQTSTTAFVALVGNGAEIGHDETETTDATLYRITLPDGSDHERPINATND